MSFGMVLLLPALCSGRRESINASHFRSRAAGGAGVGKNASYFKDYKT